MNVECHFIHWNEGEQLQWTIDHYSTFCNRIIIHDNHSDNSPKLSSKVDCFITKFGTPGVLDDFAYLAVKNECWKGSKADYVIVCDCDEILYHPDIDAILDFEHKRGTTLFRTQGYNMFSENFPRETYEEIRTGIPDGTYSKSIIFDPKAIREIAYLPGCHVARPEGRVEVSLTTLPLLHYRCIGGFQRMFDRHKEYNKRLSEKNIRFGMGNYQYVNDPEKVKQKEEEYKKLLLSSYVLPIFQ